MTDQEIVAQLQEEYCKLGVLVGRVKEFRDRPWAGGAWLPEFRGTFEHFRAHLHRQLALEETGDFMKNVLDRRPTLVPQIDRLREEHRSLRAQIDAIFADINGLPSRGDVGWIEMTGRIDQLLADISRHAERENGLVLHVFGIDIGGGD